MLALATTRATVTTRDGTPGRDAHGAPKPSPTRTSDPWAAHRKILRPLPGDASKQALLATWYLDPAAWPVHVGDTITDTTDATVWRVTGTDLVPTGLGLQQVVADAVRVDVTAS